MPTQSWRWLWIFGLLALWSGSSGGNTVPAGVRLAVTHKGLLKAANLAKSWAKDDISFYPLSSKNDFKGKVDAPFLPGNTQVDLDVSRIIIDNVFYGKPDVTLSPETESVHLHIDKASARLFAVWRYDADVFGFDMSDNGTLIATFDNGMFDVRLKIGERFGQAFVTTTSCEIVIHDVKVKLTGSENWIYDTFSDVIASKLKEQFEEQLCKSMERNAHRHYSNIGQNSQKVFVKVMSMPGATIFFNHSLVEKPKITKTYVDAFVDGSFVAKRAGNTRTMSLNSAITDFPQIPEDFDAPGERQWMLYAWLSDESINSFLQAVINTGRFTGYVPFTKERDNHLVKCKNRIIRFNTDKITGQLHAGGATAAVKDFHVINRDKDTLLSAKADLFLWADQSKFVTCQIDITGKFKTAQGERYQLYFEAKKYQMSAIAGEQQEEIRSLLVDSDEGALLPCFNEMLRKRMFIPGMTLSPLAIGDSKVVTRRGHLLIRADLDLAENYYEKNFHPQ